MAPALWQVLLELDGWQICAVVMKALTYGATFAASGGVFFLVLLRAQLNDPEQRRLCGMLRRTALLGIVFSLLRILITNGVLSGEWSGMFDLNMTRIVLTSGEGTATLVRLIGLMLICLLWRTREWRKILTILIVGAGLSISSFAFIGHTGDLFEKAWLVPRLLLCLHLFAAAFWLGALWPLRQLTFNNDIQKIATFMRRFGDAAVYVVGVLVLVGSVLLWLLLGPPGTNWLSAYGALFVMKLTLVGLLLVLAAVNKMHLTRRLSDGDSAAIAMIRRAISIEIGFACAILFVTANLTTITGPAST